MCGWLAIALLSLPVGFLVEFQRLWFPHHRSSGDRITVVSLCIFCNYFIFHMFTFTFITLAETLSMMATENGTNDTSLLGTMRTSLLSSFDESWTMKFLEGKTTTTQTVLSHLKGTLICLSGSCIQGTVKGNSTHEIVVDACVYVWLCAWFQPSACVCVCVCACVCSNLSECYMMEQH